MKKKLLVLPMGLKKIVAPLKEGEENYIVVNNIGLVCLGKEKSLIFFPKKTMTMGWMLA